MCVGPDGTTGRKREREREPPLLTPPFNAPLPPPPAQLLHSSHRRKRCELRELLEESPPSPPFAAHFKKVRGLRLWSCGMRLLFSAGKISFLIEEEERKIEWLVIVPRGEGLLIPSRCRSV